MEAHSAWADEIVAFFKALALKLRFTKKYIVNEKFFKSIVHLSSRSNYATSSKKASKRKSEESQIEGAKPMNCSL